MSEPGSAEVPVPASFPFSAVVGHEDAKLALLLAAIEPAIGGVLLRGQKGSAKTTLARALAALLPGPAPFIELPLGATEDRVIGALDLEEALTGGHRRFRPGLLHAADGGVLYVDEINLLPDHLVDVLLDVAVSGVNRIERDGLSETHPSRFVLIGSMNPEEGDLRPQLLDRFGLAVEVLSETDADYRAEAVGRRLAFDADPSGFAQRWAADQRDLATRLVSGRKASVPTELVALVSRLCAEVGAEGLRADLVICRSAATLAGWEGRDEAGPEDVRRVAAMALAHRRRRGPFDRPGIDPEEIDSALGPPPETREGPSRPPSRDPSGPDPAATGSSSGTDPAATASSSGTDPSTDPSSNPELDGEPGRQPPGRDRPPMPPGPVSGELVLGGSSSGERSSSLPGRRDPVIGHRGRHIGDRAPEGSVGTLALSATVQRSAARRALSDNPESAPMVTAEDLREAVRQDRTASLIVLAVDASASMGVETRMQAVKGAVLGLLLDAYQRRDRVALVTFRGEDASVALRPTSSVEVARARLAELPTGGRTPLAHGINAALELAQSSRSHRPVIVLISDGRATSGPAGLDPYAAALAAAVEVRRRGIDAVVLDAEEGVVRLGLAANLAEAMGARLVSLPQLSAEPLEQVLRAI